MMGPAVLAGLRGGVPSPGQMLDDRSRMGMVL